MAHKKNFESAKNSAPVPENEKFLLGKKVRSSQGERLDVRSIPKIGSLIKIGDHELKLGKEIASGGEGTIYKIGDNIPFVVKIYKREHLTKERYEKIQKMLEKKVTVQGICWPQHLVLNRHGEFVGYLMSEGKGSEIQRSIFIKNLLLKKFPDWKKRDLVELTITILEKIKHLHDRNIIMGDINPANILVASPKEVYFVDTDSYQIEDFPCTVGMVNYTAPEIQGRKYSEFLRTPGHEHFAIATLLFMLMLPGKSPYSYQGGGNPKENIIEMNFSYAFNGDLGHERQSNEKAPQGPWRFIWSHLPFKLKQKFYRTFSKNGEYSREESRLDVNEWIDTFREYLHLLDTGRFTAQDSMSGDLFPTRFKQVENGTYSVSKS